jgi:hypothetical protein
VVEGANGFCFIAQILVEIFSGWGYGTGQVTCCKQIQSSKQSSIGPARHISALIKPMVNT